MYIENKDDMLTNATKGKVTFAFVQDDDDLADYMTNFYASDLKALILASRRDDNIEITEDVPVLRVDYGLGTTILKYIDSTRYFILHLISLNII